MFLLCNADPLTGRKNFARLVTQHPSAHANGRIAREMLLHEATTIPNEGLPYRFGPRAECGSRSEVSSTSRHLASTNHNTTNMAPIDEALAAIDSLRPGEEVAYLKIATQYGVDPETLRRRALGMQEAREVKNIKQSKLSPQQEQTLIDYINNLTERRLQPTRR